MCGMQLKLLQLALNIEAQTLPTFHPKYDEISNAFYQNLQRKHFRMKIVLYGTIYHRGTTSSFQDPIQGIVLVSLL